MEVQKLSRVWKHLGFHWLEVDQANTSSPLRRGIYIISKIPTKFVEALFKHSFRL